MLFDLGGVLFHIGHVGAFGEMIGETDDGEVLRRWVTCRGFNATIVANVRGKTLRPASSNITASR